MRTYYLDSNAWAYCVGPPGLQGWTAAGTKALRESITAAVRSGGVNVIGSQYFVEEASRISNVGARNRVLDFFWETTGWLLLIPIDELVPLEVVAGGPLDGSQQFDTAQRRMLIKAWSLKPGRLDGLAPAVAALVQKSAAEQAIRKKEVTTKLRATFRDMTPEKATQKWWEDAPALIDDWVSDYLVKFAERLGLPADKDLWPAPARMQTLRAIHAYHMAKIVINVGLNRRISEGDAHDAHHYAAACYADALVTQDGALKDTLNFIPNPRVGLLSFEEFAQELGVSRS